LTNYVTALLPYLGKTTPWKQLLNLHQGSSENFSNCLPSATTPTAKHSQFQMRA